MSHSNIKKIMSKRRLLNFKINVSAKSAFSGRTHAAVLKSLSEHDRNFCASGDNWGNLCMFTFHHTGSRIILMSGSDKNWSESVLMQLPSVVDSAATDTWSKPIVSKQFQRLDPVCLSIDCSLLLTEVEDSSGSSSTVVKNITIRDSCPKSGQNSGWSRISKKGPDAGCAGAEIR